MEGFAIESLYQINDIPATIAPGKAVVKIFTEADHKSIGVISPMNRARSKELVALFSKLTKQTFVFQYGGYGYKAF